MTSSDPSYTTVSSLPGSRREGPLHIALIADPYLPVPPRLYGGIERVLAFLVDGLVDRGHRVTLWGHGESSVPCEVVAYGVPPHSGLVPRLRELAQVSVGVTRRVREFDVVHSFGRLAALLPLFPSRTPLIQSYQREITPRSIEWASRLAGRTLTFTACSTSCRGPVSHLGQWSTVYNGVRLSDYTYAEAVANDAPLGFLGRIERIKGVHAAIEVARRSGRRLIIAGNVPDEPEHRRYFESEIEPFIDGERIQYVGPVDDAAKNDLLGSLAAFLMPIEWEEPFGIVMAEAMACGTPVIGTRRGSVPEVVDDGMTGFVCDSIEDMVDAVGRISEIERRNVRTRCEQRFSDAVIVDAYERLYYDHVMACR